MITLSIDLKLIDQSKCKKITRKNGDPATFCDLVLIETPDSDYGDFMCKQGVSKEERQAGVQMPILGNGKNWQKRNSAPPRAKPAAKTYVEPDDSEIPF